MQNLFPDETPYHMQGIFSRRRKMRTDPVSLSVESMEGEPQEALHTSQHTASQSASDPDLELELSSSLLGM